MVEEFPVLRHSTQTTNKSLIDLRIRPEWRDARLADVTAIGPMCSACFSQLASGRPKSGFSMFYVCG